MTDSQGILSDRGSVENKILKEVNKKLNYSGETINENGIQTNVNREQISFGPLSKEEAERLQREANEETTNSEDLRLFLEVTLLKQKLLSFRDNVFLKIKSY